MDTVIKFSLPTLQSALENGYVFTGRTKLSRPEVKQETGEYETKTRTVIDPEQGPLLEEYKEPVYEVVTPARYLYECEGCGCFCHPSELVDTSPFDGIPNDWACGGCREKQIRINAKAEIDLIPKPEEKNFATVDEFRAADELYYREVTAKRHEVARAFKKGLLESHSAPPELVALVGIIDKDEANRALPPVAKAAATVMPAANEVTVEMVDAGSGIQPGKKARIGSEEVEVTGVSGDQVTITRANPQEHPQGEQILFNIDGPAGS